MIRVLIVSGGHMRSLRSEFARFRGPILVGAVLTFIVGMAVALALRGSDDDPVDTSRLRAVPADCRFDGFPDDARLLAIEVLSARTEAPVLDEGRLDSLTEELSNVLMRVRARQPQLKAIHVFPDYEGRVLVVEVPSELVEGVELPDRPLATDEPGPTVNMLTGAEALDELNAELGLAGVEAVGRGFADRRSLLFCYEKPVNVPAAVAAYRDIEEVLTAEPNYYGGDGPDIAAVAEGDTWYVVFRDAEGDCPAGCISETFYYFEVDSNLDVEAIDEGEAERDARFARLVEGLGFNPELSVGD